MKCGLLVLAAWLVLVPAFRAADPDPAEFFERRVRPVLAEHCFGCHGPKKQKGGLRLDSAAGLHQGGDDGPVVVPGAPTQSLLIQAVRYDGATKMPPRGKLPPEAIEALTAWVKAGAPWPRTRVPAPGAVASESATRHWAFQPVQNPLPPPTHDASWPVTPLDRFVLARLQQKGLTPSPPADRRTLIRRVTFDLLGLPPTPAEIDAFLADRSPEAYDKLIERLLASPHYGERWGRYWLDVARYADTKGYVFFEEADFPWSYTYRDYVIRAFNEDVPYDRFIVEQLAADQLPLGRDRHALAALGFLTLGGRFMNNRQDILDDRIDVVTRGLLGLTVTCARCHDHKFDPIPSKDYYSLYGVFASCREPTVPPLFADPPATPAYAAFARELQAREEKLRAFVRTKHDELMSSARSRVGEYLLAVHRMKNQPATDEFMLLADGSDLNPKMLLRWRRYLERRRRGHDAVFAPWYALAALPEKEFAARARGIVSGLRAGPVNPLVVRALADKPPRTLTEAAQRYAEVLNGVDRRWQSLVQEAARADKPPPGRLPQADAEQLRQVFYGPDGPPNVVMNPVGDLDLLPDRPSQARLQELRKAVESWRVSGPGAPPRAMVLEDLPSPYEPHVFLRGNPNLTGEAVPRQFLSVLAGKQRQPFRHGSGRLDLARGIADRRNPLTARVFVNRVWLHHFGAGLVHTPSDFGLRSDPPTHPKLLDYLATWFMDHGWSVKQLHRLIVRSAVYRQQSADRPDGRRLDPENLLLWRMNRRRLDFEATRDALLAVSGQLDPVLGGPPVRDLVATSNRRRTVYGYIDRLNLPNLFRTFDFPSPDATSPQRDATTVPQQALFLMNSPFAARCARALLRRAEIGREQQERRRIAQLYPLLYGRPPETEELYLGRQFVHGGGSAAIAWEHYVQALLLANEFVFVD